MQTHIYRGKDRIVHAENKNRVSWTFVLALISFFAPIILMLPGFYVMKIFPFGANSTMAVDLKNQYAGFYEAFRRLLTSPSSFSYSWSKSIGGEMLGTFAYYVMGPVNLIMLLFSRSDLPIAIEVVQIIKLGLCGLSMSIFLISTERSRGFATVVFSTLFALCSFITANLLNHMWLDVIWIFPIVVLFLERMLKGYSPLPYVLSLTILIISCYYMSFMACFFLVLYSIYALVRAPRENGYSKSEWIKNRFMSFCRFIIYSVISGGIAAFILSPILYSLSMSKRTYAGSFIFSWKENFFVGALLSKLLPASFSYSEVSWGLPNIFSGTIIIILSIFYFFVKSVSKREKVVAFFIIAFMLISMYIKPLNLIWHGLQGPNWYPYRYSWLLSFFLIVISHRTYKKIKDISRIAWPIFLLLYILMIAYLYLNMESYSNHLTKWHLIGGSIVMLLLLFLLYCLKRAKFRVRSKFVFVIGLICLLEISTDAAFHTGVFNYENILAYKRYDSICMEALEKLRPHKNEFWRISKTFRHDNNDAMRFNYSGLSHFNSHLDRSSSRILSALGFASSQASVVSDNSTKFTDGFFGIRYYLESKENDELNLNNSYALKNHVFRPDTEDMSLIDQTNHIYIKEINKALSIGHMFDGRVKDFLFGRKNPIDSQDMLANMMDGNPGKINYFSREVIKIKSLNNMDVKKKSNSLDNFKKISKDKPASVVYDFTTYTGASYYLTVSNTLNDSNSELYIDGKKLTNKRKSSNDFSQVYNVASSQDGNVQHSLEVKLKEKDSFNINNISLFRFNEDAWDQALNYQLLHGLKIETFSPNSFSGTVAVDSNNPYLVLTIPYDEGWRVWVDGEAKNYERAMGNLIMLKLDEGKHTISMSYQMPYLVPGIITSLLSLIVLLVCNMVYIRKSKYKKFVLGQGSLTYELSYKFEDELDEA